jgi:N-acetyltransferase
MLNLKPIILNGYHVTLESFNESHRNDLRNAAQDERIWTYNGVKAFGHRFDLWFDKALKNLEITQQIPFVVRRIRDGAIIGSTRYYDISPEHRRLTIGYTWYIPDVWGSVVNPECKYLLLSHAFEALQMNRVEFVTDVRNLRSRAAIKKLGAMEEGILRRHMILEDGYIRDTAVHSIVSPDWPNIKSRLNNRVHEFKLV